MKKLGHVSVMVSSYANDRRVKNLIYIDDPINEPFWEKIKQLSILLYLHPWQPPPDEQEVYQGYKFLADST